MHVKMLPLTLADYSSIRIPLNENGTAYFTVSIIEAFPIIELFTVANVILSPYQIAPCIQTTVVPRMPLPAPASASASTAPWSDATPQGGTPGPISRINSLHQIDPKTSLAPQVVFVCVANCGAQLIVWWQFCHCGVGSTKSRPSGGNNGRSRHCDTSHRGGASGLEERRVQEQEVSRLHEPRAIY